MISNFSENAKKMFLEARLIALSLKHAIITPEHLLLALLQSGDPVILKLFEQKGVSIQNFANVIKQIAISTTKVEEIAQDADMPIHIMTKNIIDTSKEESKLMGLTYVGLEHMFLAYLSQDNIPCAKIFKDAGFTLEETRQEIAFLMSGGVPPKQENQSAESTAPEAKKAEQEESIQMDEIRQLEREKRQKRGKQKRQTPVLDAFSVDLTALAQEGKLDPVIGRDSQLARLIQILARRTKNNPVLLGDPGVGKTAIVEGLAQKIIAGEIPFNLRGSRVLKLNMATLIAGTKYRGEFEERISRLVSEVVQSKDVILFIDELHTIIGAGGGEGTSDAANILKPALARGEFQLIGATTTREYRLFIEKDQALERRFQTIDVPEPTEEETVQILRGLAPRYAAHHGVTFSDEAIVAATHLSKKYITDRFLPDKAIDLLDEAGAAVKTEIYKIPEEVKMLDNNIQLLDSIKEKTAQSEQFNLAIYYRDTIDVMRQEAEITRKMRLEKIKNACPVITKKEIAEVVSLSTGIPVARMTEEENKKYLEMEAILKKSLVGQDEAVSAVCRAVRRGLSAMKDPRKPVGSFLFLGPTGVGKTELAKVLCDFMFNDRDALIRFDMSEFMERHEVSKLIGSPPGYVGFDEGGKLTDAVKRHPYSVVLFDEIEKAHPDVFNLLLQVLDDGRLTDGQGRFTDFSNCVIIMTSNAGVKEGNSSRHLGFTSEQEGTKRDREKFVSTVKDAAKKLFKPEFLNRIDETCVFNFLDKEELTSIVELMLNSLKARALEQEITLELDSVAMNYILEKGTNRDYGARPLKRAIQNLVEDPVSDVILSGEATKGDTIFISREDGADKLSFRIDKPTEDSKDSKNNKKYKNNKTIKEGD